MDFAIKSEKQTYPKSSLKHFFVIRQRSCPRFQYSIRTARKTTISLKHQSQTSPLLTL